MEPDNLSLTNMDDNVAESEAEPQPGYTHVPYMPIALTGATNNPLMAEHIERVDDLPEYPVSHEQGYVYAVKAGGRSREELVQMIYKVQYPWSQQNGKKELVFSPYLSCRARKLTWKCSGIYCCEFLDQKIRSYHHTSVDESIWQDIEKLQGPDKLLKSDMGKRNAYNYYRTKVSLFKIKHACIDQLPDCKPVFRRFAPMGAQDISAPYIGCSNGTDDFLSKHHRATGIAPTSMDLDFLEELFNKDILPPPELCGTIEPVSSRKKHCDRDHPQGRGQLEHLPCEVTFHALVPADLEQCPYIVFSSHGVHKHPPPMHTKTPKRIPEGSYDVGDQKRGRGLTTKQFLESPEVAEFCRQHNASSLAEIHPSLANNDVITRLIRKQRLEREAAEEDINSLIRSKETDEDMDEYLLACFSDGGDIMVGCAYGDQIAILSQMFSFDIDKSVKRVGSKDMNEISFTTFLPQHNKLITFLRVFTNSNSPDRYSFLFEKVFGILEDSSPFPLQFGHIHGSGLGDIMIESGTPHYTGLGQYLSEIDPLHRQPSWHLEKACAKIDRAGIPSVRQPMGTGEQAGQITQNLSSGRYSTRERYSSLLQMVQSFAKTDKHDIVQYKYFLWENIYRSYRNPDREMIQFYMGHQREHESRKRRRSDSDSSRSASTSDEVARLDMPASRFGQPLDIGDDMDVVPSIEHPEPPESEVLDDTPSYAERRRELEYQKEMAELDVELARLKVRRIELKISTLELDERERKKEIERIA
ncbi:hypothetical protein ASPVEDRAFT_43949 [Aspergillus versicolor CBS 583.65]|uniref:Uncharacterized protein n=1 Tax=Aspergillus versicolor CBS 583.65 TaxID=1036611 RepID=A0A1L9PSP2_ASPVE|nr:uncharacterized protein ASPVEDRAFT_43949 [Aspergillus versicolor CBS 583.65]OJJ04472.1 hypothetical protein ASPVEDRAFT_43949 [Aspergillus versicolor CBS 583.65]